MTRHENETFSERDHALIRSVIRKVADRIEQDVSSMELAPRSQPPEFTIVAWARVAQAVREWESDLLFDLTGFDDGT